MLADQATTEGCGSENMGDPIKVIIPAVTYSVGNFNAKIKVAGLLQLQFYYKNNNGMYLKF